MQLYVWRHNRKFHSYRMIDEPCVQADFYTDALAVVLAENEDEALQLLAERDEGWIIEDLRRICPQVYALDKACVALSDVRGT